MTRFHSAIGMSRDVTPVPGVHENRIVRTTKYFGDVIRQSYGFTPSSDSTNSDVKISNRISVIADRYLLDNLSSVVYVEFGGVPWTIASLEIEPPRVIFTLGAMYDGELGTDETLSDSG